MSCLVILLLSCRQHWTFEGTHIVSVYSSDTKSWGLLWVEGMPEILWSNWNAFYSISLTCQNLSPTKTGCTLVGVCRSLVLLPKAPRRWPHAQTGWCSLWCQGKWVWKLKQIRQKGQNSSWEIPCYSCLGWYHFCLPDMSLSGGYPSVDHSLLSQSEFTLRGALIKLSTLLIV